MRVVKAKSRHRDAVVSIMNQGIAGQCNAYIELLDEQAGREWFKILMKNAIAFWVLELEGEVAGWGTLTPYRKGRPALDQCAEITFYVHEDFRKRGVASELISALHHSAIENRIAHLIAILLEDNEPSKNILAKHGYRQWGLLPDIAHFPDKSVGHLYMGLSIGD